MCIDNTHFYAEGQPDMEIMEKSMGRAVVFDLYETLITENYPEWHVEAPTPGERLGLAQEDSEREWSARYQARMTWGVAPLQ